MIEIVNSRISTNATATDVLDALAGHFTRLHATLERDESSISAMNPRKDETITAEAETRVKVTLTRMEDGWLLNGAIDNRYKPSWILFMQLAVTLYGLFAGRWLLVFGGIGGMVISGVLASNRGTATKKLVSDSFDLVKNQLNESKPIPEVMGGLRKCPSCAEMVQAEAIRCRFCQLELTSDASNP